MNNFRYFDIETIPSQSPDIYEQVKATVKPPASMKKQETIDTWWAEKSAGVIKEKIAKTSFDAALGHVCSISCTSNDDELIRNRHAMTVRDEAWILNDFFRDFDKYHSETIVGHFIHGFDVPFLTKRAIILGVELPTAVSWPRDPKPWSKNMHDTMVMWAGAKGSVSMDDLCKILGIEGKGDFDGSMVADAWANGEHQKIADYCSDDVRRTREIHKRFLAAGF